MYDMEVVQQALQVDGFKITVCRWLGFYTVIRFKEDEHIPIFWDLKQSLLKPWFTNIDTVDNFMNKKKLRVCVRKEGIPLMALVVYQTFLRRSPFHLRVKRFGCKFQSSSLMMRDVGSIKSSRRAPLTSTLGDFTRADPLIEVPVEADSGSFDSSKQRLSLELAFDPSSGLYSIKPKSLRYFSCLNSLSPGLCLVNNKLGLNNKLGKSGSLPGQDSEKGRSKRGLVCPRKILQGHNDCKKNRLQKRTSEYKHKTDKEEEARGGGARLIDRSSSTPFMTFYVALMCCNMEKPKQFSRNRCVWECPVVGELKLNVDDVVVGGLWVVILLGRSEGQILRNVVATDYAIKLQKYLLVLKIGVLFDKLRKIVSGLCLVSAR
ncbi:hypothetical protein V6N12_057283 [Hibiscus sabdariffa]|uniref:DUF4283 domain-containing protein n=1 Tax=Hibiscus sabdariffa TaxID=183260 RepID=A0ABR2DBR8_9ROSI